MGAVCAICMIFGVFVEEINCTISQVLRDYIEN